MNREEKEELEKEKSERWKKEFQKAKEEPCNKGFPIYKKPGQGPRLG